MEYFLSFLEGIITFVSPCLLPMLPVYLSYLAGGETGRLNALKNALGFVLGFSALFTALGAFAGKLGSIFYKYQFAVNLVCGAVMVLFGLNFIGVIKLKFINDSRGELKLRRGTGFFSSALFGSVFSISWTPCLGTFLGSALMLAAQTGSGAKGVLMLLCFSLGLGVPFIMSALIMDSLKGAFDFIKRHFRVVNIISGILLIVLGIIVATGMAGYLGGAI